MRLNTESSFVQSIKPYVGKALSCICAGKALIAPALVVSQVQSKELVGHGSNRVNESPLPKGGCGTQRALGPHTRRVTISDATVKAG